MRTAEQEYFGEAIKEVGLVDHYHFRLPRGQGGCRCYHLSFDDYGFSARLPDARKINLGGFPILTVFCGDRDFDVIDQDDTVLVTLAAGECATIRILDNSTLAGQWIVTNHVFGFQSSSAIAYGRKRYDIYLTSSTRDFNILNHCVNALGYDGVTPAAVRLTVGPHLISASSADVYALDTGGFPTGSSMFITLLQGCVVTGAGGPGGRGGNAGLPIVLPTVGGRGGHAMRTQDNTVLVNYGLIQSGGGGGGGGIGYAAGSIAGGGGGGGAGAAQGQGGNPGTGGGADYGQNGMLETGGDGGFSSYNSGARGGDPGQPGIATAAGPAALAGDAIQSNSGRTFTKIRAGTIIGAETTY